MAVTVNDIHSELNATDVLEIVEVDTRDALQDVVARARDTGVPLAISGGRHAMGGQQFCSGGLLLDTRPMDRLLGLDAERGLVEVEAGIQWPALIAGLERAQQETGIRWGIAQKQTGADRMTIGGAVAANVHGRGLTMAPLVSDIEGLTVITADGEAVDCNREQNPEVFSAVVGGYGLFGCIYAVTLRLAPRRVLERVVEITTIPELARAFEQRIADGFLYGDFQFATDETSDDFLHTGVFSCYRPADGDVQPPESQRALSRGDWTRLIALAHTDKRRAFAEYSGYYLSTSGQLYHSDTHQLADYEDGYHRRLDAALGSPVPATEMISELYVPRERLADFMAAAAEDVRQRGANVIYGTIRLIERDDETFLAWARDRWACVIFNLHTEHSAEGIERSAEAFRGLTDLALERDGSYFLTYHRWATREQVEAAHPRLREALIRKSEHDPQGVFQSDWYRHHRTLLGLA